MFTANAAWLVCAAIAHNLTRAGGALASAFHARARTATLRAQLINTPGRIARSARARWCYTYPATGPGKPGSTRCSAKPCTTRYRQQPDHRPEDHDRENQWKCRAHRQHTHPPSHITTQAKITYRQPETRSVDPD